MRSVEALHQAYRFPKHVRLMDGGTQGLLLLSYVCATSDLCIFDAIDFGLRPGELRLIWDDDVPRYMGAKKVSMHQTGFQEVLAAAKLMNQYPKRLALIGVQPEELDDYGGSLRPRIKARIPEAISLALDVLQTWGVPAEERHRPPSPEEHINSVALTLSSYEQRHTIL